MMTAGGKIVSINISPEKGVAKTAVSEASIIETGIEGDGHGGSWHRQVSLLALESLESVRDVIPNCGPGDFAENITTKNIPLWELGMGTHLRLGEATLEITQIGKKCNPYCELRKIKGRCRGQHEWIFARVVTPGKIGVGDIINVLDG